MARGGRPPGSDPDRPGAKVDAIDFRIIRFLRRKPQPVKAIGESSDGEELTVSLAETKSSKRWADAARVLRRCTEVRALDRDGSILRVLELDRSDPTIAAELELEESKRGGGRAEIISIDVPRLVDNIARNMREVAEGAAAQQSEAFSAGFAAMTNVVNLCLQMLARVDQRLEQAEAAGAEPPAESPDASRNQMAMMALQSVLGGGMGGGSSNGASKVDLGQALAAFQQIVAQQQPQTPENPNGGH